HATDPRRRQPLDLQRAGARTIMGAGRLDEGSGAANVELRLSFPRWPVQHDGTLIAIKIPMTNAAAPFDRARKIERRAPEIRPIYGRVSRNFSLQFAPAHGSLTSSARAWAAQRGQTSWPF